ncbi:MAG: hypothetical protein M3O70_27215, partial [Actinomycetota bacterium]|nr:hypothetical protein [Actinomycetota bacterium]
MSRTSKATVTTLAVALLLFGLMVPLAGAQEQDGLVNVAVGDITIEDVNVTVAAQIAAAICANLDLNAAVLAVQEVDEEGTTLRC